MGAEDFSDPQNRRGEMSIKSTNEPSRKPLILPNLILITQRSVVQIHPPQPTSSLFGYA